MNPARLYIRGYVVNYWPIFLLGKYADVMEMGAELTETVQRLAFLDRIFGADISFELNTSLGPKGCCPDF